jgi:hypothetical protein
VRAPFLLGFIDVIAVPSLALFSGTRIVRWGACAAAKAYQDSKKADNFAAGNCGFHIFSHSRKRLPSVHLGKSSSPRNRDLHPWIYEIKFDRYRALAGSLP